MDIVTLAEVAGNLNVVGYGLAAIGIGEGGVEARCSRGSGHTHQAPSRSAATARSTAATFGSG